MSIKLATERFLSSNLGMRIELILLTLIVWGCQTSGNEVAMEDRLQQARQLSLQLQVENFSSSSSDLDEVLYAIKSRTHVGRLDCSIYDPISDEAMRQVIKKLPEFSLWHPQIHKVGYPWKLAHTQYMNGNYSDAVRYMRFASEKIPYKFGYVKAKHYSILALYHAGAGEIEKAEKYRDLAKSYTGGSHEFGRDYGASERDKVLFHLYRADGVLAELHGDMLEAEANYRLAMQLSIGSTATYATDTSMFVEVDLARNLMRQYRFSEAETVLFKLIDRVKKRKSLRNAEFTRLFVLLARIRFEQGRLEDAKAIIDATIELYNQTCVQPSSVSYVEAKRILIKILVGMQKWQEAIETYDAFESTVSDAKKFDRLFGRNTEYALALLKQNYISGGRNILFSAYETAAERFGKSSYQTGEIRGLLAMSYLYAGERKKALQEFELALNLIIEYRAAARNSETTITARDNLLRLILESYIGLLMEEPDKRISFFSSRTNGELAFQLAQIANLGSVQKAFTASQARFKSPNPELQQLIKSEQDASHEIKGLLLTRSRLHQRTQDSATRAKIGEVTKSIDGLKTSREDVLREIKRRFPKYANLIRPEPLTLESSRERLDDGELLILTLVGDDRSFVWAVDRGGLVETRSVDMNLREVGRIVAQIRTSLEPMGQSLADIPAFDLQAAHVIYDRFVRRPLESAKNAKVLYLVKDGPLGNLPFALLPTKSQKLAAEIAPLFSNYRQVAWLGNTHAIVVLPAVNNLTSNAPLKSNWSGSIGFLGVANPVFNVRENPGPKAKLTVEAVATRGLGNVARTSLSYRNTRSANTAGKVELSSLPALPDTEIEVIGVANALQVDIGDNLLLGKDASEGRIKSLDLTDRKVIIFATHGLVPGDLTGLVEPALALTSPSVTGESEDGVFTMSEVMGLSLDADWVVLSACNTALGDKLGGEAISGLGKAFLYAGARSLLVSNWPIESRSARELTTKLFEIQSESDGMGRPIALKETVNDLIRNRGYQDADGNILYSYAHPIFWAPFSIVGR